MEKVLLNSHVLLWRVYPKGGFVTSEVGERGIFILPCQDSGTEHKFRSPSVFFHF